MSWRHVIAALAISAGLGWFGVPSMAQSGNVFKGRLSKVPVDAKMLPIIIGTGNATATLKGTRVTIAGTYEGLGSPATVARLHEAKFRGGHGPVIGELVVTKAASGTVSGDVNLTTDQITALKAGKLYVQIHTAAGPEGHLWGFLLP
ncbi:MAG: CHRD domain-containing protein [Bryobacteraceae bacterium]